MVDRRIRFWFTFFTIWFVILAVVDVSLDALEHGEIDLHIIVEALMLAGALVSIILLWSGFQVRLRRSNDMLQRAQEEFSSFRSRHAESIEGMRRAMEDQFARWKFSETEKKIADALIRGYSLKQIAALHDKSERTVRNQTTAIYEKSGMTGRSDLAAFFLADLFPDDVADE